MAFHQLINPHRDYVRGYDEEPLEAQQRVEEERKKAAFDAAHEFTRFFRRHRILFAQETCAILESFQEQLWDAWSDYTEHDELKGSRVDEKLRKEMKETRRRAWEGVAQKLPQTRLALEGDFRRLLGVIGSRDALPKGEISQTTADPEGAEVKPIVAGPKET